MPSSYRTVVALVVMLVVTVAVFVMLSRGPITRISCDAYNVWSLGDASHPPVFITPPPGWKDLGGGCWGT